MGIKIALIDVTGETESEVCRLLLTPASRKLFSPVTPETERQNQTPRQIEDRRID